MPRMARMLSLDPADMKNTDAEEGSNIQSHSAKGNWKLAGLVLFFLFFLAFGASIFSAIESPIEKLEVQKLIDKKSKFLKDHPCITDSALDDLITEIVNANIGGVSVGPNGSYVPSWSFGQSFFFSTTVVTTIGYGHQSPLSAEGKSFCILYALIGIPMTLLLLTAVVERLLMPLGFFLRFLNSKLGHLYSPFMIRILHLTLLILAVIVFLFLIPAAIFTCLEPNWNYLDSLYYCFISLTTVGLGDFIPGDSPDQTFRPLYKACTTFYLLIGVTAMTLTLSVIYSIPELDLSTFFLLSCGSGKFGLNGTGISGSNTGNGSSSNPDPERIRLHSGGSGGTMYTQQIDERQGATLDAQRRTVVRARSRPNEDSPSPSEADPPEPGPSGRVRLR